MVLITNDVEIDAYYLSHGLWSCLNERHTAEAINDLVNFYHKTLSNNRTTSRLYSHCEKIGFNQDIPLWDWYARGFAGVLHYSALEKIWDKVIGGSIKILAYVALTKVELAQNAILGCHTANEAIRCLTKVSEEDITIAQKAIESWSKDGRQILAPSTYSLAEKSSLQLNSNENQLNQKHVINQINVSRGVNAENKINLP